MRPNLYKSCDLLRVAPASLREFEQHSRIYVTSGHVQERTCSVVLRNLLLVTQLTFAPLD